MTVTIPVTTAANPAARTVQLSRVTMNDADATFAYTPGNGQFLVLQNVGASPINGVAVTSDYADVASLPDFGEVDVSGGVELPSMTQDLVVFVEMDLLLKWWDGPIKVIGLTGTGMRGGVFQPSAT